MQVLVVVAAGSGQRLGATVPKALVPLGGSPLVSHTLARLAPAVDRVVVVAPPGHEDEMRDHGDTVDLRVVRGGPTRSASVAIGIRAAEAADEDLVAVHDAARPLTPAGALRAAIAAVEDGADVLAAAPALPVVDTLKRLDAGRVVGTVPREDLRQVQTPQVATARTWRRVHDGAGATDDLALVEQAVDRGELDGRVVLTSGSVLATKVTRPADLLLAAHLLAAEDELLRAEGWA